MEELTLHMTATIYFFIAIFLGFAALDNFLTWLKRREVSSLIVLAILIFGSVLNFVGGLPKLIEFVIINLAGK